MESRTEIAALINSGGVAQHIAFGVLTCEKMLPQYELFQNTHQWGDIHFLKTIIAAAHSALINPTVVLDAAPWRNLLDRIFPDLDEFEGGFPAHALDTCIAFDELLSYIISKDGRHIHSLSESAFNSVDMYIQEKLDLDPSDPALEEKIASNPAMLTEELRQKNVLIALHETVAFTPERLSFLQLLNNQFEYLGDLDLIYDC